MAETVITTTDVDSVHTTTTTATYGDGSKYVETVSIDTSISDEVKTIESAEEVSPTGSKTLEYKNTTTITTDTTTGAVTTVILNTVGKDEVVTLEETKEVGKDTNGDETINIVSESTNNKVTTTTTTDKTKDITSILVENADFKNELITTTLYGRIIKTILDTQETFGEEPTKVEITSTYFENGASTITSVSDKLTIKTVTDKNGVTEVISIPTSGPASSNPPPPEPPSASDVTEAMIGFLEGKIGLNTIRDGVINIPILDNIWQEIDGMTKETIELRKAMESKFDSLITALNDNTEAIIENNTSDNENMMARNLEDNQNMMARNLEDNESMMARNLQDNQNMMTNNDNNRARLIHSLIGVPAKELFTYEKLSDGTLKLENGQPIIKKSEITYAVDSNGKLVLDNEGNPQISTKSFRPDNLSDLISTIINGTDIDALQLYKKVWKDKADYEDGKAPIDLDTYDMDENPDEINIFNLHEVHATSLAGRIQKSSEFLSGMLVGQYDERFLKKHLTSVDINNLPSVEENMDSMDKIASFMKNSLRRESNFSLEEGDVHNPSNPLIEIERAIKGLVLSFTHGDLKGDVKMSELRREPFPSNIPQPFWNDLQKAYAKVAGDFTRTINDFDSNESDDHKYGDDFNITRER